MLHVETETVIDVVTETLLELEGDMRALTDNVPH